MVDDSGYGDVACHGNPHVKAPNIDAFADQATDLMNWDPAALEAVVLFQNQLEDVAARTGARVGDQTARKIAASRCEGQQDFHNRPICMK